MCAFVRVQLVLVRGSTQPIIVSALSDAMTWSVYVWPGAVLGTTVIWDSPREMTPVKVRVTHWPGLSVNPPWPSWLLFPLGRAILTVVQGPAVVVVDEEDVLLVLVEVVDDDDEELLLELVEEELVVLLALELKLDVVVLPEATGTKTSSFPPWPLPWPWSLPVQLPAPFWPFC